MIIEESKRLEKLEFIENEKNKIDIEIIYTETSKYNIQLIPSNNGIIIKYKTLKFKCISFEEYTKIYRYIIKQIDRETFNLLLYRYEFDNDFGQDYLYTKHIIIIKKADEIVFYNEYTGENINTTTEIHFPSLFYCYN